MEHIGRRCAICVGLVGAALVWLAAPSTPAQDDVIGSAQPFLDAKAESAALSEDGRTWTVEAGDEVATIDAATGELLEIQF